MHRVGHGTHDVIPSSRAQAAELRRRARASEKEGGVHSIRAGNWRRVRECYIVGGEIDYITLADLTRPGGGFQGDKGPSSSPRRMRGNKATKMEHPC